MGLQMTFEELQGWLSSYEGSNASQTAGEAYEKIVDEGRFVNWLV